MPKKPTKAHIRRSTAALTAALVVAAPLTITSTAQASASSRPSTASNRPFVVASARHVAPAVPSNVRLYQTRQSLLGTHTWYRQVSAGRTVVNGWYAVHQWRDGQVTVVDERKGVQGLVRSSHPITANTAVQRVEALSGPAARVTGPARLMVLPSESGTAAHQAWRVLTTNSQGVTATYVGAENARILRRDRLSHEFDGPSPAAPVTGRGRVFDPNPVVALQREGLTDRHDTSYPAIRDAYRVVDLPRLDDSHSLKGQWVRITNNNRATSNTDKYKFGRESKFFEQVSAYYDVDAVQNYLQTLGFSDVNAEAQRIETNTIAADNSFYDLTNDKITMGRGGVDDAEDPEVTWHEYGHAVQDDQVPNFGTSLQAASIGEGFGDYLAATMSQENSPNTKKTPWSCLMDWDSTSYTTGTPHCIRRTNLALSYLTDRVGEPHADGQIWSGALWQMNRKLGRDIATQIIVEAQFSFPTGVKMPAAGSLTVQAAQALFPGHPEYATITQEAFESRDIL
jgi:hypothetical protein